MDPQVIFQLSLDIDKYFASLPNTQAEIVVATLSIISFKLKDEKPNTADLLMKIVKLIAESESCNT